jgi:hypothetical protein
MPQGSRRDRPDQDIERQGGPLGGDGGSADEIWEAPTRPDRPMPRVTPRRRDGEADPEPRDTERDASSGEDDDIHEGR